MTLTRRRTQPGPDLSAAMIAILLRGWSAEPPATADPGPDDAPFLDLYEMDSDRRESGMARLWTQHQRFLRETAHAWGWEPTFEGPDGTKLFYAEAAAEDGA